MLDSDTRRKIDTLRDILVGKIPNPQTQVEQITTGLIYKFMDDMDQESIEMGGEGSFFVGDYEKYAWKNLLDPKLSGVDKVNLYSQAIEGMYLNPSAPQLFRDIFKNAFLPFKDPSTLNMFLKEINEFNYSHSEKLGDAFEYLISIMGSQGDAGQFRTPRHIIDFIVEIVDPQKNETILDPACGTAGFLISSYKHILKTNTDKKLGDQLSAEDKKKVGENVTGYDISPEMIRLSLVNMYLHGFSTPKIDEYDTLSSEDKWNEYFDVILANPPFFSPKGGIQPHNRFGVSSKKAEVLFTSYILDHLKPDGRAGIIIPEGIIFQNGKAYKELRKQILENALMGIISLPAGVFQPYSGVKTSILILDKKLSKGTDSIFFVEVKNDGFSLGSQRTPIQENDLPELVKNLRNKENDSELIKKVSKEEILNNSDFSFSFSTYQKQEINNSNFEMVKMGEIADFQNGYAFKPSDRGETGKPIIRIQNLTKSGKDINRTQLEVDQKYHVEKGDLLISWSATIGVFIWEGESALLNQHIFLVKPNNRILKGYLYFLGSKIKRDIESKVHGNTMTHITKGKFLDIEIPLPPLEVQQEIVDELEGHQKIIDGCKQVIENYKPTIDIDSSWEMVELGEIIEISRGASPRPIKDFITDGEGENWIKIGDASLSSKYIHKTKEKITNEGAKKSKIVNKGDFILSNSMSFGRPYIMATRGCIHDGWLLLKYKKESMTEDFLYYILSSSYVYKQFERLATGGVVNNLNKDLVSSVKIPFLNIEQQNEITFKLEEERKVLEGNKKLIEIYTQKIQDRINKVWGED